VVAGDACIDREEDREFDIYMLTGLVLAMHESVSTVKTWAEAVEFCASRSAQLATLDQYCPGGPETVNVYSGQKQGDQWVPYSGDGDNAWVQIGTRGAVSPCRTSGAEGRGAAKQESKANYILCAGGCWPGIFERTPSRCATIYGAVCARRRDSEDPLCSLERELLGMCEKACSASIPTDSTACESGGFWFPSPRLGRGASCDEQFDTSSDAVGSIPTIGEVHALCKNSCELRPSESRESTAALWGLCGVLSLLVSRA